MTIVQYQRQVIEMQDQYIEEQQRLLKQTAPDALIAIHLLEAEQYKARADKALNRAAAGVGILVVLLL